MKTVYEIFEEFMVLLQHRDYKFFKDSLNDIKIGDNILARLYNGTLNIYYLDSGCCVYFSDSIFNLLWDLYCNRGSEILGINKIKRGDKVSKFIVLMMRLFYSIQSIHELREEDLIKKICETGSKDFRDWCKKKYSLDLCPVRYKSLQNNLLEL